MKKFDFDYGDEEGQQDPIEETKEEEMPVP